jgi:hypothetical protein
MIKPAKYEKEKMSFDYKIVFSYKENRARVLDFLFRTYSLISDNQILNKLSNDIYNKISIKLNSPSSIVQNVIEKFLIDLNYFRDFFKENRIRWENQISRLNKKVRIFLHKIFRLAPIFDYKRARINLERLHQLLNQRLFWPKINTQVAIIIYITDKNDSESFREKKILQKNIRVLCDCSAYAFHRTRNMLGIQ